MNPRARFIVATLVALAGAGGCRKEEVRPEELFQAQSRGLGFLENGQLLEAEVQFKRVVALAPNEPLGYANLGLTHLRGARFAEAEKQLRRARELDPANVDVGLMLARLHASRSDRQGARSILDSLRTGAPRNPRVPYALAELDASQRASDPATEERYGRELSDALALVPGNVAVRLKLIESLVRRHRADSAVAHLEEIRRIGPELPPEASSLVAPLITLLRAGDFGDIGAPLARFLHLMELTQAYQASLDDVRWLEGPLSGRPILSFTPKSLAMLRATGYRKGESDLVRFVDATSDAGLPATVALGESVSAIATGDYDGDGIDDLFVSVRAAAAGRATARLYHVAGGQFGDATRRAGLDLPGGAQFATFADLDNDGRLDLFVLGDDGRPSLWRTTEGGRLADVTARSGLANGTGGRKALVVDLDHDGDLDVLLVGGTAPQLYRNNLDGTFTDVTAPSGLGAGALSDAAFADLDDDGRIDVLAARGRATLYRNSGNRQFTEGAPSGITADGASIVAIGDYDNDGLFDVVLGGSGAPSLWRNTGAGTFRRDTRSAGTFKTLGAGTTRDLILIDYDNDGWLDLVVAATPARDGERGVFLFRNDRAGGFLDRSSVLPPIGASTEIIATDVNSDGAEDLVIAGKDGVRLLRNEGGGLNLSMQLQLVGLRTGSGKNNFFGIGARVEVRAAELYQTRVVTSRVTRFGLGSHLKADVIRVQWPNGVPQTLYFPGSDQDVIENEVLKGSCAFLYAWDGKAFR
ncbi:MAG: FG-GAP-like repeat-containing protein, partial [Gemmatimonadaceae bacterium]